MLYKEFFLTYILLFIQTINSDSFIHCFLLSSSIYLNNNFKVIFASSIECTFCHLRCDLFSKSINIYMKAYS